MWPAAERLQIKLTEATAIPPKAANQRMAAETAVVRVHRRHLLSAASRRSSGHR